MQPSNIMSMAEVAEGRNNLKQLALAAGHISAPSPSLNVNNPLVLFRLVLLVYHLSQWFRVVSTVGSSGEEHYEPLD